MPDSVMATGKNAKVGLIVGEADEVTLTNNNWSLNDDTVIAEGHNAKDGTRRVPGRFDCSGSVSGFYDGSAKPHSIGLKGGAIVTLKLYLSDDDAAKFYSLNAILSNVAIETQMDDLSTVDFDFALASGTLTNPV